MAQGFLKIQGRIPLEQFWPKGESDADTTNSKVEVGQGAFRFREHQPPSAKADDSRPIQHRGCDCSTSGSGPEVGQRPHRLLLHGRVGTRLQLRGPSSMSAEEADAVVT